MNVTPKSQQEKPRPLPVLSPIKEEYTITQSIGQGSFGDIFEGFEKRTNKPVAIKVEKKNTSYTQLEYESKVYRLLHQAPMDITDIEPYDVELEEEFDLEYLLGFGHPPKKRPFVAIGIPACYLYKSGEGCSVMVMELCGPSLEDLFNYCHRRFSLKTVLMLAEQILNRIEFIHDRGLVHRDIKTDNFVFGIAKKSHILHLIDFGLSKLYWDSRRQAHIPFVCGKPLTGTARYCSINAHRGYEQSRRDDLESVGYVLVYLLKGSLPWQGMQDMERHFKSVKIGERKIDTSSEELCKGLPNEFLEYCKYCRRLSFQERPNYNYLRDMFRQLGRRLGYICTLGSVGGDRNPLREVSKEVEPCKLMEGVDSASMALFSAQTKTPAEEASIRVTAGLNCVNVAESQGATRWGTPTPIPFFQEASFSGKVGSTPLIPSSPFRTIEVATFDNASYVTGRDGKPGGCDSPDGLEPHPRQGYYDWMFDWFHKRRKEVQRGKADSC